MLCKSLHISSTFFHNSYSFPQFLHNKPVISTIILYFFPHKFRLWKLWTLFLAQAVHPFSYNDLPNVFNQAVKRTHKARCKSVKEALYLLQQLKHSSRTTGVPSKLHAPPLQQLPLQHCHFEPNHFLAFMSCSLNYLPVWRFMSFLLAMQR